MKPKLRFHVVDNGNQKYNTAKQAFEVLAVAKHEGRTWIIVLTRFYFPIRKV
jgi:hypothetical protein